MKTPFLLLATTSLALTVAWLSSSAARPEDPIVVDYTFRSMPLQSLGAKTMADLRGKPVVIDFWGKN